MYCLPHLPSCMYGHRTCMYDNFWLDPVNIFSRPWYCVCFTAPEKIQLTCGYLTFKTGSLHCDRKPASTVVITVKSMCIRLSRSFVTMYCNFLQVLFCIRCRWEDCTGVQCPKELSEKFWSTFSCKCWWRLETDGKILSDVRSTWFVLWMTFKWEFLCRI